MTNLTTLKDDFTAVVVRFCAWITKTIEALVKAIKSALEQLERDLERLRRAAAAAIIGGMLADAGAPVSNLTKLEASSVRPPASTRGPMLITAKGAASELGQTDYVGDAVKGIDALGKLWQAVTNDAQEIERWLKDGAEDAVGLPRVRSYGAAKLG